jgi:Ca2+-binding RTX toxin-like protein
MEFEPGLLPAVISPPSGKEVSFMRRTLLLLSTMMLALLLAGGVALAAAIAGINGDDTLRGTNERDTISGAAGDD